jgi:hypothetical protein
MASSNEADRRVDRARASRTISDLVRLATAAVASSLANSGLESFTVIVGILWTVLPLAAIAIPQSHCFHNWPLMATGAKHFLFRSAHLYFSKFFVFGRRRGLPTKI